MQQGVGMNALRTGAVGVAISVLLVCGCRRAAAEDVKSAYPAMAPLSAYQMDRNTEIALARTAAPAAVSNDAEVQVLGRHKYETAVRGKNGFVCVVQRSWASPPDDPDFWNPKLRAPICFNAPAARSQVAIMNKRTELVLGGASKPQFLAGLKAGFDKRELVAPEPGSMCYMMSKQGYLNSRDGHWHPHLMFFTPLEEPSAWGANFAGSPILAIKADTDHYTLYLVPVGHWSDGTPGPPMEDHSAHKDKP
jgi:hypothetical protein